MKRAFTLIEMLIVIGIIAVLAAVLLSTFGGAQESARLARCQSNLRNLCTAVNSYVMESDDGTYPDAGFGSALDGKQGASWISWGEDGTPISCMAKERELLYALTNGILWKATGGNSDVYKCPVHDRTCFEATKHHPGWSYVMSAFFSGTTINTKDLRAERRLMFAEMPGLDENKINLKKYNAGKLPKLDTSSSALTTDAVLQYKMRGGGVGGSGAGKSANKAGGGKPESIGFNHVRGNSLIGLVAFADGHTEAITLPKSGDLEELTGWLCEANDISLVKGVYRRIEDTGD